MNRKRLISGLLAAAVLMGAAACDRNTGRDVPADISDDTAEVEDTAVVADTVATPVSGTSDSASTESIPLPEGEGVLFKYSDVNAAWSFHWLQILIAYNGDVYIYEKYVAMQDNNSDFMELRYLTEYTEPAAHIDQADLEELYNACLRISPDVKTEMTNTGNDRGEFKFSYVDPEYHTEIPLIITGDETMVSDDPALNEAAELAKKVMDKYRIPAVTHKLFLDISTVPALSDRRTVNVPYVGTDLIGSHMLFEGYDSFIQFCEENGIDFENYLDDKTREHLEKCPWLMVQVFDSGMYAGGVLITKDPEDLSKVQLEFLPSLEEYEYNPEYDGKVNMAVWGFLKDNNIEYLDENGDPWVLYG